MRSVSELNKKAWDLLEFKINSFITIKYNFLYVLLCTSLTWPYNSFSEKLISGMGASTFKNNRNFIDVSVYDINIFSPFWITFRIKS